MSDLEVFNQFEGEIRKVWDEATNEWWYAVVDIVGILSEAKSPRHYWADMKRRDDSGALLAICQQFIMISPKSGRKIRTDCANQVGILRIIQSIPSPKAEPLKQWLALTGSHRLDEIKVDPLELEREKYRLQGYDEKWISARINSIATRNDLTDEWEDRGVQGKEYGVLTNTIHKGAFDMNVQDHKRFKGVEKGNLRDHMNPAELAISTLGEFSTLQEIEETDAQGFQENLDAAQKGGDVAGKLRQTYEETTGRQVMSNKSYIETRKRLLDKGRKKNQQIGICDQCSDPVTESETYGTEAGNLCQSCFDTALDRGEINEDGEVL